MQSISPSSATLAIISACSFGALGLAFIGQYGFDLWPCLLCHWQRPPYFVAGVLGLLALMPAVDGSSRQKVVMLCAMLFAINVGIAVYHVGVEELWWKGPAECVGPMNTISMNDLLAAVNQPGRTGCEEAAFRFLGISMAGYNVIACLALALGSAMAASKNTWWTSAP